MTILATQWVAASAMADCVQQGQRYAAGQKHAAGGICQANGTWNCGNPGQTPPDVRPGTTINGKGTCQPDGTWG